MAKNGNPDSNIFHRAGSIIVNIYRSPVNELLVAADQASRL